MTRLYKASIALVVGLATVGAPAYGVQPPDVVASDAQMNTAMGASALATLTTGVDNTAAGANALYYNASGFYNAAFGAFSLLYNSSGYYNTAVGVAALEYSTNGFGNTAIGYATLVQNSTASANDNTAVGNQALYANSTAFGNTGVGSHALQNNTTGSGNIAIGYQAGQALTTGDSNIDIGNSGVAGERVTIRIGDPYAQKAVYIAGIANTQVTGSAVYVTRAGQLGVLASSERYKTAITSMGAASAKIQQLRPVTFQLKTQPEGARQFGLIAEEVEQVYPELVIRDEAGTIQGVRYDELAPMLLNEVQQQQRQLAGQADRIAAQSQQLLDLQQQLAQLQDLNRAVQVALLKLQAKNERLAAL